MSNIDVIINLLRDADKPEQLGALADDAALCLATLNDAMQTIVEREINAPSQQYASSVLASLEKELNRRYKERLGL